MSRAIGGATIHGQLTRLSVLASTTALVPACLLFIAFDAHSVREALARRSRTEAQILGLTCVSPLLFNDADSAQATLDALRAESAVAAAVVVREPDGQYFASFSRSGAPVQSLIGEREAKLQDASFGDDFLLVGEPIRFEGTTLGRLVIRADLREIGERRRFALLLAAAVLAGSFLLAFLVSRRSEAAISRPILALTDTARAVSQGKDYSVRARLQDPAAEMGLLVSTFNEMLDRIQDQNASLEAARADLEARVAARTRELAAANRELESFSYSVSHDLRAPLRAIDGFSKVLLSNSAQQLDDQGRHYLQRVRAGATRMAQLIDDLLGLAQVSRKELVRKPVDVTVIATQVTAELAKRHSERQVEVAIQPGMTANADAKLLTIVLENLLGNAWKFTGKRADARLEIGARQSPETAFYVQDNGAGFNMAFADKLFGAFQRLHTDADFEGTGIGLATVQRVVNRHGGRIWAESELGKGATFYFTLEPK